MAVHLEPGVTHRAAEQGGGELRMALNAGVAHLCSSLGAFLAGKYLVCCNGCFLIELGLGDKLDLHRG